MAGHGGSRCSTRRASRKKGQARLTNCTVWVRTRRTRHHLVQRHGASVTSRGKHKGSSSSASNQNGCHLLKCPSRANPLQVAAVAVEAAAAVTLQAAWATVAWSLVHCRQLPVQHPRRCPRPLPAALLGASASHRACPRHTTAQWAPHSMSSPSPCPFTPTTHHRPRLPRAPKPRQLLAPAMVWRSCHPPLPQSTRHAAARHLPPPELPHHLAAQCHLNHHHLVCRPRDPRPTLPPSTPLLPPLLPDCRLPPRLCKVPLLPLCCVAIHIFLTRLCFVCTAAGVAELTAASLRHRVTRVQASAAATRAGLEAELAAQRRRGDLITQQVRHRGA